MATLVTLVFQGEVATEGTLSTDEAREIVHGAFPLSPPRDATTDPGYRAFKTTPLSSGRLLVSTVLNRGDVDEYERPVLRANGYLLDRSELSGPARDLCAVWEALAECDPARGEAALEPHIAQRSIHTSPEAFATFRAELGRAVDFYARLTAVLIEESADLYFGDLRHALELLRPALGLLPAMRLAALNLAIGGEATDVREPILGLPGAAPESWREVGVLSSLFGRKKEPRSAAAADLESQEIFSNRSPGPRAMAEAIVDPQPWPTQLNELERYRVLLRCIDSGQEGRDQTPFDIVPELDELRRAIQRIEDVAAEMARWP
ncbi:MAG: hypothetical protein AAF560_18640 [Acidobacteriota bacterium]